MKKQLVTCAAVGMMLMAIGVAPAAAQDKGSVGLLMGSGSTVGLTIQLTESVAIRPSVAFARATGDNGGIADGERTSTGWAPGLSVVFNIKSWDATRLYLSPQWTYSRSTIDEDGANETTTTGHALSAMVGAQHNLGSRFAVFAETGIARSTSKSEFLQSFVANEVTSWSTRSAIGAILFF